jgi:hypothetical protein
MTGQSGTKINSLLKIWPKGTLAVVPWLEKNGVSRQLADSYLRSRWLDRIDNGVYKQAGDNIDWTGAVYTLQQELFLKINVAAKTALELNNMGHYLPFGANVKILFASEGQKMPLWFKRHFQKQLKVYFPKSLFTTCELGLQEKDTANFSILISSPERAILECLYLVPKNISLELAVELMEKLRTLRPQLIQSLLESCRSIKVKRLFLYLAEMQQQPWLKRLNLSLINLGKGKRVIGTGGKYNAKYKISLPDLSRHEGLSENENEF